ncbi:MAG: ABC transporter permease [Peptococcaceae bacterium]|nr:MAG: ABC transporter permease [Peptococcaceae bacterium]
MLTIALLTWREVTRRRFLTVAVILTFAFLSLYGLAVHFANKEVSAHVALWMREIFISQLLVVGLYFASFIVSFLAVFAAVGTVSGEIESGVMHAVAARPIRRAEIICGKLLGNGLLLVFYAAVFFTALSATVYIITGFKVNAPAHALALFCLQPLILLSISTLGSTLLSTMANGIMMFMLYAIAVVGGMVEQIGWLARVETMQKIGILTSLLMPVDAMYRKIVHIMIASAGGAGSSLGLGPFGSYSEPSVWMLVYTLLYIAGTAATAVYIFNKKDIG